MTIHNHEAHKTALNFLRLAAEWRAIEADALGEAAKLARQGCVEAHDGSCGFAAQTLREAARLAEEADFQRRQFDYYWGRMNDLQKQIRPEEEER